MLAMLSIIPVNIKIRNNEWINLNMKRQEYKKYCQILLKKQVFSTWYNFREEEKKVDKIQ